MSIVHRKQLENNSLLYLSIQPIYTYSPCCNNSPFKNITPMLLLFILAALLIAVQAASIPATWFGTNKFLCVANVRTGTGPRWGSIVVNFTLHSSQTLDLTHKNKILCFMQGITLYGNSSPDIQAIVSYSFLNASFYVLYIGTSNTCTINQFYYNRVIFDQTVLQSTYTTYTDVGTKMAYSSDYSGFTLSFVYSTLFNFMIGMTSFSFTSNQSPNFAFDINSKTCSGTMTFNRIDLTYFNFRERSCPAAYPLFCEQNSMCYDVCDYYYYKNPTYQVCMACNYACYTCNPLSPTACLSCNPIDNRFLNGSTCSCLDGNYNNFVSVCQPCNYTCKTCNNLTSCKTCDPANFRTLTSNKCPCNAGYTDTGAAQCVNCSQLIAGCSRCVSISSCLACNASLGYSLVGSTCVCTIGYYLSGSTCTLCSAILSGCLTCISGTVCTACDSLALYSLSGGVCICSDGYYDSGAGCVACSMTGCISCTDASTCTACNTVANFDLSGTTCVCPTDYFLSGSTCVSCATLVGCINCGATGCTACDSSLSFILSAGSCVCATGFTVNSGACVPCSTILVGCTSCTSPTSCTTCNSSYILLPNNTCGCTNLYYLDSTTSICTVCNASASLYGCKTCTSSTVCTLCDSTLKFVLSAVPGVNCECMPGYYLFGTSCLSCSTGCLSCTDSSTCLVCNTAAFYTLSGSACVCDLNAGYVKNSTNCVPCGSLIIGCSVCLTNTTCSTCNSAGNFVANGSKCMCNFSPYVLDVATKSCYSDPSACPYGSYKDTTCKLCTDLYPVECVTCTISSCTGYDAGYYLDASNVCKTCSSALPGCTVCTSGTVCTECDLSQNYLLSGSTCGCVNGYALDLSSICKVCSSFIPGCLSCSSRTVCNSCDLSLRFVTATDITKCDCVAGYYLDLTTKSCLSCSSITGCLECLSVSVCTVCDNSKSLILSSGSCACTSGFYLNASAKCTTCSSAMTGCLVCSSSAVCSTCNSVAHFSPAVSPQTNCVCQNGYYFDSPSLSCLTCPIGCATCTSATVCNTCKTTSTFALVGTLCSCIDGTYLNTSTGVCNNCKVLFTNCVKCTVTACITCQTGYTPSALGKCECALGYFNNSIICQSCATRFFACSECTDLTCTKCDLTLHYNLQGGACVCERGFVLDSGSCLSCSGFMFGCNQCLTISICLNCDNSLYMQIGGGSCECVPGYYLNPINTCILCKSVLPGCDFCYDNTNCTLCDTAHHFFLNGTECSCQTGYSLEVSTCVKCIESCHCAGYAFDPSGVCGIVCGDGVLISPEVCDDGNMDDGDGCSSTCSSIESDFSCYIVSDTSFCSYTGILSMTISEINRASNSNQLTFTIIISPNIKPLDSLNFSQIIYSNIPLYNPVYTYQDGVLSITYDFNTTIEDSNTSFTINPSSNIHFFATPSSSINFIMKSSNNIPIVVYDQSTFENSTALLNILKVAVYTSYVLFFIGLFCDKIVGTELFGVLQIAFFSVSNIDSVQPLLAPIMKLKMVNGFNTHLLKDTNQLPARISSIEYYSLFLNNFNYMYIMLVGVALIGAITYLFSKNCGRVRNISTRILKEFLLMLVMFNCYNIAYSLGLQYSYSKLHKEYFVLNTIISLLTLAFTIGMTFALHLTYHRQFGEFKNQLKRDHPSRSYFTITIVYRLILGLSMSVLNERENATMVNMSISIFFFVYQMVNLPFRKGYHNYRALWVQVSCVAILTVTTYYRALKSSASAEEKAKILQPAFIYVAAIYSCIFASAGCLMYELYLRYLKVLINKESSKVANSTLRINTEAHLKEAHQKFAFVENDVQLEPCQVDLYFQ